MTEEAWGRAAEARSRGDRQKEGNTEKEEQSTREGREGREESGRVACVCVSARAAWQVTHHSPTAHVSALRCVHGLRRQTDVPLPP
jgi:hypothetical protein